MSENNTVKTTSGFTDAEREAMQQRAAELRSERGGNKKADNLQATLDAIAAMPDSDRQVAERVHAIILRDAPHLLPKTWYGMPAYADGNDVICFFQAADKFDSRYATLGFNDKAQLDNGDMWPTAFAITAWTETVADRVVELVSNATN